MQVIRWRSATTGFCTVCALVLCQLDTSLGITHTSAARMMYAGGKVGPHRQCCDSACGQVAGRAPHAAVQVQHIKLLDCSPDDTKVFAQSGHGVSASPWYNVFASS